MGKEKFIAGMILLAVSIVCCAFGNLLLYEATHVSDLPGVVAAIIFIVFAVALFVAQFICGIVAEILLWINVRKDGYAKTSSIVLAVVCMAAMLVSAAFYIISAVGGSGDAETSNAIILISNFLENI